MYFLCSMLCGLWSLPPSTQLALLPKPVPSEGWRPVRRAGTRIWESGILFSGSCFNPAFLLINVPFTQWKILRRGFVYPSDSREKVPERSVNRSQVGSAPVASLKPLMESHFDVRTGWYGEEADVTLEPQPAPSTCHFLLPPPSLPGVSPLADMFDRLCAGQSLQTLRVGAGPPLKISVLDLALLSEGLQYVVILFPTS